MYGSTNYKHANNSLDPSTFVDQGTLKRFSYFQGAPIEISTNKTPMVACTPLNHQMFQFKQTSQDLN